MRNRNTRYIVCLVTAIILLSVVTERLSAQIRVRIPRPNPRKNPPPPSNYPPPNHPSGTTTQTSPPTASQTANDNQLRDAFVKEAVGKYLQAVQFFAPFYDEKYISGGRPTTAAGWQKALSELGELDALCRGKYAGVTNDLPHYLREGIVQNRYAVWCEIAARRIELDKRARAASAKTDSNTFYEIERQMKASVEDKEGFIHGDVQTLIYERERWKQEEKARVQARFAELGAEMPADYFIEVERKADEVKKIIDHTAPTRSFTPPKYQDAASQALAKREFAKMYPGIQVLKIGSDYETWKVFKNSYGIPTNQYKRGWALARVPKRPYCQAKEWIVKQTYVGGRAIFGYRIELQQRPLGRHFYEV